MSFFRAIIVGCADKVRGIACMYDMASEIGDSSISGSPCGVEETSSNKCRLTRPGCVNLGKKTVASDARPREVTGIPFSHFEKRLNGM
jgi:hypothetical protein